MSVLSDRDLYALFGRDEAAIGPASVDVRLGYPLIRLPYGVTLDPEVDQSALWTDVPLREDGRWMLGRGDLYLGVTDEIVSVPNDMVALLHGLSSLGRMGLLIHATAGLIDPGNTLKPTLEIVSLGGSILLRPGMRIGQITYHRLSSPCLRPYQGKYLGDIGPVPSRMFQEVRP